MQPLIDARKARYDISRADWVTFFPDQDPDILLSRFSVSMLGSASLQYVSKQEIAELNKFLFEYIPTYVRINYSFSPPRLITGNGNDTPIPIYYDKSWASKTTQMLEFMDLQQSRHGRRLRVIDQLQWIIWKYKK